MEEQPSFVRERTFDAPRQLVWDAWTDPELMQRCDLHGQKHTHHKVDIRPGGVWLLEVEQKAPIPTYRHRYEFTEVSAPERLVSIGSSVDADWKPREPRLIPGFPHHVLQTVTLETRGDRTLFRLTQVPHEASEKECERFAAYAAAPQPGMDGYLDRFAELLHEMQKQ